MDSLKDIEAELRKIYADSKDIGYDVALGELTVTINPDLLISLCWTLHKKPFYFEMLIDICGIDFLHYGKAEWKTLDATKQGFSRAVDSIKGLDVKEQSTDSPRYATVYHLLSLKNNKRIRIVCQLDSNLPRVVSVCQIWASANWYEREAFELFGILFDNHPDLRRLLTDYGFIGYPFRKDFPLIGEVEMRYDAAEERIVYEPVSIEPRTLVAKVIRKEGSYSEQQDEAEVKS